MSIPPSIIRVKRKRVEESPVTFLHVDPGSKRHRSGSTWAYQRRDSVIQPPPASAPESPPGRPVIHVSGPDVATAATKRQSPPSRAPHSAPSPSPSPAGAAGRQSLSPQPEPRQFRIALVTRPPASRLVSGAGISKRDRYGPALFVERARKQRDAKSHSSPPDGDLSPPPGAETPKSAQAPVRVEAERQLKRPGTLKKSAGRVDGAPPSAPLPASLTLRPGENLDEIAADMDRWVLNEIRESLGGQDQQPPGEGPRFKPKSPAQRYHQRHPDGPASASQVDESADISMTDADQDSDAHDWVIEEYVRIPASAVAQDVSPSDVGLLVLDDDEESNFFFGPSDDDDDDDDDNDDDENAENHYTADYPEDEADSNDEDYDILVGGYGNGDASDNDDFDYVDYDGQEDCPAIQGNGNGDDDDARMARIRNFLKRSSAFG